MSTFYTVQNYKTSHLKKQNYWLKEIFYDKSNIQASVNKTVNVLCSCSFNAFIIYL